MHEDLTVYILTIGDSRHGDHIHGVYSTETLARRHVKDAFQYRQRCYGGSAEFEVIPDANWFRGKSGGIATIEQHEVRHEGVEVDWNMLSAILGSLHS